MKEFDREISDLRLTRAHFVEMTIHLVRSAAKHLVEFLRCLRGGLRWLKVALKATLRLLRVALSRQAYRFLAIRLLKAGSSCPECKAKASRMSSGENHPRSDAGFAVAALAAWPLWLAGAFVTLLAGAAFRRKIQKRISDIARFVDRLDVWQDREKAAHHLRESGKCLYSGFQLLYWTLRRLQRLMSLWTIGCFRSCLARTVLPAPKESSSCQESDAPKPGMSSGESKTGGER